jgi:phosphate transport system protein
VRIAQIARRRHPQQAVPDEVSDTFAETGRLAVQLANSAQEVVESRDPRRAAPFRHDDDAMEDLHNHLFRSLMDREWSHGLSAAVDVTLLGRFYEWFAVHTIEIGRRIIFRATGEIPGAKVS